MRKAPVVCCLAVVACAAPNRSVSSDPVVRDHVRFTALADGVWMHTSLMAIEGYGLIPTNGLIVVNGATSTLIDTAWDDAQTKVVLRFSRETLRAPVARAVLTHAHSDKMGGVGVLRKKGIATWAHRWSNIDAPKRSLVPAEHDLDFDADGRSESLDDLDIFYPGGGHTRDNIVVAVNSGTIVFGGCLIRPPGARSIGNTSDAVLDHWAAAVLAVASEYPHSRIVVPSHGPPGGRELYAMTAELARTALAELAGHQ